MRIRKFIIIAFVIFGLQNVANAQDSEKIFTIYLVRHAEKELVASNPKDPQLTQCGQKRAESLVKFLKAVDLDAIYSTDYIRTKSTAQPISTQRGLEILKYNPKELNDFAKLLIGNKKDVLVVGHSNTTGVLAGLLAGEEIGSFNEDIYNRIYQVVIYKDAARLHILHSSFYCNY
jgi:broad specificity phosphatase PhoE